MIKIYSLQFLLPQCITTLLLLQELLRLALESPQVLEAVSEHVSYDEYMGKILGPCWPISLLRKCCTYNRLIHLFVGTHSAKGWKELRFDIPKHDQSRTESSLSSVNSDASAEKPELAITGIGGQIQDHGKSISIFSFTTMTV